MCSGAAPPTHCTDNVGYHCVKFTVASTPQMEICVGEDYLGETAAETILW